MKAKFVVLIILGFICLVDWIVLASVFGSLLPNTIATHFNGDGEVDGSGSKAGFIVLFVLLGILVPLFLMSISLCIRVIPQSLINISSHPYLMRPPRRSVTISTITYYFGEVGVFLSYFFQAVFVLTAVQNLIKVNVVMYGLYIGLPLMSAYLVFWAIRMTCELGACNGIAEGGDNAQNQNYVPYDNNNNRNYRNSTSFHGAVGD